MLKATVNDGPEQLWLEEEISKARAVDGDVGALDVFLGGSFGPIGPSGCLHLIVFIVQELIVHIVLCHNRAGRGRREVSELGVPEQVRKQGQREGLKNSKGKDTSFRQKSWERGQQKNQKNSSVVNGLRPSSSIPPHPSYSSLNCETFVPKEE